MEVKVEPDDFHDSSVKESNQIEATSGSSVLLQNNEKSSENKTGNFYNNNENNLNILSNV